MNTRAAQQQWKTKKLGDIGHCLRGVSYDPTTDLSEYDKDSTIRLLRANNIQDAIINTTDIQHVESRRVSEDQIMKPNDILICMANGSKELVGKAGQFRVMDEYTYTFGAFMACFRIDSTIAEPKFAFYLFQTREFRDFISLILAGSSINNLKPSDIESAEFQIPNRNEQRAIAEVLSDVDGLIDSLDTLIVKKRAIKQSIMQQLLTGKTRLPGSSGAWETKRLGEIASFFKGSSLFTKADMSVDGKRRCIHYGELFTTYGECITEVLHGTDRAEAFFLSVSNDVLMPASDVTPNGLATASCLSASDIILGGDILVIRVPANIINGVFLAYVIRINHNQVMQLVSGTTVYHLYSRDMANFTFVAPSVQEQNAIVRVLSDMDAEITALEQRRDKTRAIKQGMMQQLLTGRVRLVKSK